MPGGIHGGKAERRNGAAVCRRVMSSEGPAKGGRAFARVWFVSFPQGRDVLVGASFCGSAPMKQARSPEGSRWCGVRKPACLPLSLSGSSPLRRRSFPAPCLLRAVDASRMLRSGILPYPTAQRRRVWQRCVEKRMPCRPIESFFTFSCHFS